MIILFVSILFISLFAIKNLRQRHIYRKEQRQRIAAIELAKALEQEYEEKYNEKVESKEIINDTKPYKF